MGSPVRYTYGIATVTVDKPLGNYPLPDPFHTSSTAPNTDYTGSGTGVHTYFNDFNTLIGADWTVTGISSTFAVGNGNGGVSVLTPGGITTATVAYKNGESFQFNSGYKLWYVARLQASGVGADSFTFGLQYGSATTDGVWFSKAASSSTLTLVSSVSSTATTLVSNVATLTAATYFDVGFYVDNYGNMAVYANDTLVARVTAPSLTTVLLTPFFAITPAATETLTVDYVLVANEVSR